MTLLNPPLTPLSPQEWAQALYGGAEVPGWIEYRLIQNGQIEKRWARLDGQVNVTLEDVRHWIQEGWNVYYGVALRKERGVSGDDGVLPTPLIWADLDLKDAPGFMPEGQDVKQMTPEALEVAKTALCRELMRRCELLRILPAAVVNSGHGLQVIWKREASSDTRETEALNLALCEVFKDLGADKKTRNAERILRLPSSENLKNPARPLPVEVWHLDPAQTVSQAALDALTPEPAPRPAPAPIKPPSKPAVNTGNAAKDRAAKRRRAEVAAALRGEVEIVAGTLENGRNHQLNISAMKLARFLPFGELEEGDLIQTLTEAALAAGLDTHEIRSTIRSGIAHGTKEPAEPERFDAEEEAKEQAKKARKSKMDKPPQQAPPAGERYALPQFPFGVQEGTDAANAHILATNNLSRRLRYTSGLGWFVYQSGGTWKRDTDLVLAEQLAGKVLRHVLGAYLADAFEQHAPEEERKRINKWANAVCNRHAVGNALAAAAGMPEFYTQSSAWDADPFLLNCKNGVLELRTGTLRPHSPDDLMTWQAGAAFDPAACHPYVDQLAALLRADGRHDFLQRSTGSALCGIAPNETLHVLQGPGGTGKGTHITAVTAMLGDYAGTVEVNLLLSQSHGESSTGPKPELLELRGKRLVVAGEPPKGARFNAGRVKGMTGNDPITARTTHSPVMVTFTPVFKLWIHTNYSIATAHDDSGMERRIHVVPFSAKPTKAAPEFKKTLETDPLARSAFLNWALEGFRLWYAEGYELGVSEAVKEATLGYLDAQNPYKTFASERLIFDKNAELQSGRLKTLFEEWAEENGHKMGRGVKIADLHAFLKDACGCSAERTKSGRFWVGVTEVTGMTALPQVSLATSLRVEKTQGTGVTSVTRVTQKDDVDLAPASGEL